MLGISTATTTEDDARAMRRAVVDRFPSPAATALLRAEATRALPVRLDQTLHAGEALLQFLASIVLADACDALRRTAGAEGSREKLRTAIERLRLQEGSFGTWVHVLREVSPLLEQPFVLELQALTSDRAAWRETLRFMDVLRERRNEISHPRRPVSDSEAEARLPEVDDALVGLFRCVPFLMRYPLLAVEAAQTLGATSTRLDIRRLCGGRGPVGWERISSSISFDVGDLFLFRSGAPAEALLLSPFYRVVDQFEDLPDKILAFARVQEGQISYYRVGDPREAHSEPHLGRDLLPRLLLPDARPMRRAMQISVQDRARVEAPPRQTAAGPLVDRGAVKAPESRVLSAAHRAAGPAPLPAAAAAPPSPSVPQVRPSSAGPAPTKRSRFAVALLLSAGVATIVGLGIASSLRSISTPAEASYRAVIAAYNAGDEESYFAGFLDPLECYYDTPNVPLSRLRASRTEPISNKQSRYFITAIDIVTANSGRAVFWQHGRHERGRIGGDHHKLIEMKQLDGVWRIASEADAKNHRCLPLPE